MTALEEIKKALEGVRHSAWFMSPWHLEEDASAVRNSDDFSYICNASSDAFAAYIASVNPPAISELLSTLESLQRENEALRGAQTYTYIGRDGKSVLARDLEDRAEAAEAGVNRLREALQNVMGCYDTPLSRRRFPPDGFMTEAINTARTALASTGGEHNGN